MATSSVNMPSEWMSAWKRLTRGAWRPQSDQDALTGLTFTRSVYGPYLCDTPGDRTFELAVNGYGPFVADAIAQYDRPFLFLDIGANLGLFSLLADTHPLCRKVIAIEPIPRIFEKLEANLIRNAAQKVTPIRAVVTDGGRRVRYVSYNPRHSGKSALVPRLRLGAVRARTLDAADLATLVPAGLSILAKVDVEGSEIDVLSALRRGSFYGALNDLIIEISAANLGRLRKEDLVRTLASDGFVEVSRRGSDDHYDALFRRDHP